MHKRKYFYIAVFIVLCTLVQGCKGSKNGIFLSDNAIPDTLRIGTIYSPTSYFIYKGEEMGYEYELISRLLEDNGKAYEIKVGKSIDSLISMLDENKIDIIACEIPITYEYKKRVLHCGKEDITRQVLVQPRNAKQHIKDVTQLIGKTIYVEQNSKYEYRLKNLNNEIGGGIIINAVPQDSLIAEDLIEMVSDGKIPLTVVDSDIARLNKTYYRNIDISLEISFPQRSSWAVHQNATILADSINSWTSTSNNKATAKSLLKRYFEISKDNPVHHLKGKILNKSKGIISPYDAIFKKYAKEINFDWRLLAAQGYSESRFDTTATSWAGAKGIMQLMPKTARSLGVSDSQMRNPETSVMAAVKLMHKLDRKLDNYVKDPEERIKFILAAYNSGLGHVMDAINLAKKYGKDPTVWHDNVEVAMQMKTKPEYYNDEVCRFGYFKGKQTVVYVEEVGQVYEYYRHNVKE